MNQMNKSKKKVRKMKKYAIFFDEFNIIPDLCRLYGDENTKAIEKILSKPFSEMVFVFDDLKTAKICYVKQELIDAAEQILKKILDDPKWGLNIIKMIVKDSNKIINTTEKKLKKLDPATATNKELWKIYQKFNDHSIQQFVSGSLPMILEVYEPKLSNYILKYLKTKVKDTKKVNEVFSVLITPEEKTTITEEEIEFLNLCSKIMNDKLKGVLKEKPSLETFKGIYPEQYELLKKHYNQYNWLPHEFLGPVWEIKHFYENLLNVAESSKTPQEILEEIKEKDRQIKEQKKKYIIQYNIDEKHQQILKVAQGFMYTKSYRKERFTHSFYYIYKIYREICRRFGYTLDECRWMLYEERKQLLLEGKKIDKKILNKRNKGCVMVSKKGATEIVSDNEAEEIKKLVEIIESPKNVTEIKGMIACQGYAKGCVKLVFNSNDIEKMKQGDILVAPATNPDVVPAMKKAAAIVTDAGGVTSHAAIISRELGVPCLIGTKISTKVLKDGDFVEVDAETNGIVKILKKA